MNAETRAMLGLDEQVETHDDVAIHDDTATNAVPASPTALNVDGWGLFRGEQLATDVAARRQEKSEKKAKAEARKAAKAIAAAPAPAAPAPAAPPAAVVPFDPAATERGVASGHEMADFHAVAFNHQVRFNERCVSAERAEYVRQLLESPDVIDVRHNTVGNVMASEIAAHAFAERWLEFADEQGCRSPNAPRKRPSPSRKGSGKPPSDLSQSVDMMKAAATAARQALRDVEDFEDAMSALGCGGDGGADNRRDPKRVIETYKRVRGSARLKKIAEKAGRFRRMAAAKQRMKTTHGIDDMVGVTTGSDLARLTTVERSRLTHPMLADELMVRLAEGKAQLWEHRGTEPAGKGPIVVVVDESGSMDGNKIEAAKALALAMAYIARKQKRWTALVGFSGGTEGTICMLPPTRWDETALMDWLEHFYSGGTSVDVPLVELPNTYWPQFIAAGATRGKTDVILITDGEVDVPPEIEANYKRWAAAEKVKTYCLMIDSNPGDLDRIASELHRISSRDLTPDNAAIGSVLSV